MNNRIKKYLDSMEESTPLSTSNSKKPPSLTGGDWVSVHVFYDRKNGEIVGVHAVKGKSSVSDVIMRRVGDGIYDPMEMDTFNVRIETEDTDNG